MNIEQAVATLLTSHQGLAGLVAGRISPIIMRQGTSLPAITYTKVSAVPQRDLQGVVRVRARIQVSCWAASYAEAKAVAAAVRDAMQDYQGTVGDLEILDATVAGEYDQYEPDTQIYHVPVDVVILYRGGSH